MAEDNIVHKIKRWKPVSKRPIWRPETRWEDIEHKCTQLEEVAEDRDSWNKVVEQARTLYRL